MSDLEGMSIQIIIHGLLQEKSWHDLPQKVYIQGVYPYFREIEGKQGTEVEKHGHFQKC